MTVDRGIDPVASFERELAREDERERQSESLWRMSAQERERAMWAGELSLHQLCEWSRRRPNEVPKIGGEFAWIVVATPEWIEARDQPVAKESGR